MFVGNLSAFDNTFTEGIDNLFCYCIFGINEL